jgi:hypothetical protein
VFANIINIICDWVRVVVPSKASIRHIFLILRPGNAGILKDIDNRCDWCRDGTEVIVADPKIVPTNDGNVILLSKGMK